MMRWNVRVLMNPHSFCSGSLFSRDDMRDAAAAAPAAASAAYLPTRLSTAASKLQPADIKHPALILIIFPSSKCCAAY